MALSDIHHNLKVQLRAGIHAALTSFGHHMALITRSLPQATADELLARPDASGYLRSGLSSAQQLVKSLTRHAWSAHGGPPDSLVIQQLLTDIDDAYVLAASSMRTAIRSVFAAETDSAQRPQAVADAIRSQADKLVVSGHGSLSVASGGARTASVLEEGRRRQAAGEHVGKMWVSKLKPTTCRWCRALHGTVIPLDSEFDHGSPAETPHHKLRHVRTPAGAQHFHREIGAPIIFTYPPKVWGFLWGPPRHPECECEIELVSLGAGEGPAQPLPPEPEYEHPYIRASDIAAMSDPQYHSLLSFLTAAVHELRLLIRRLLGL